MNREYSQVKFRCKGCGKIGKVDDIMPPDVCDCGRGYGGAETWIEDVEVLDTVAKERANDRY